MGRPRTHQPRAPRIATLLAAVLLVGGCAGFEPFEPRDDRVEGPKKGLFSGEAGEFVIFRGERVPKEGER